MGSPAEFSRLLKKISVPDLITTALEDTKDSILVLQKDQLKHGLDSSGNAILPEYASDSYAKRKNQLNSIPQLGTPDLTLSGDRNDAMTVTVDGVEKIVLNSSVEYNQYNEERYGANHLWGLTPDNRAKYVVENLRPAMKTALTDQTGIT